MTARALTVEDLHVCYPDGRHAVRGVAFTVDHGETLALVGESGCGKTSVAHSLLGLLPQGTLCTGSARVGGVEVVGASPGELRHIRGRAVGYVPQDPFVAFDPLRTVGHHVAEAWRVHGPGPGRAAVAEAVAAMGIPGAGARLRQRPHQWSGGMLQRAAIAAGVVHRPHLTVADEPTSALDADLAASVLRSLRAAGESLLLISHDLPLVARHADRVAVMCEGRIVEIGAAADVLANPSHPYTRELVASATHSPAAAAVLAGERTATPGRASAVLAARGVSRTYALGRRRVRAVDGVDLAVRPGEIIGVYGRSGSGKSSLLRMLAAVDPPDGGEVLLDGRPAWSRRYGTARRQKLRPGYVMPIFQDPFTALDVRWPIWRSITEPLTLSGSSRLFRAGRPSRAERRAIAAERLRAVGLDGVDIDATPTELSIGQCQRVAVVRALAAEPAVVVADEPTSALDAVSALGVVRLLRECADAGTALVVVSHDERVLRALAGRVFRMAQGRLSEAT
ncbi:peptide/nickel transport system ATP-binding protein [Sinosporangium album]|uniref:Peptide/nickel transport system ATP-binding protein n=1 Tax=Sinosporangium album TaxID=504805 RepID=A0A1G7Z443_9ACTN|nr:ABC transporter ATP-binding protein [Sinosporangium album]SDH03542.1 peptide/nickel transport system ATP-binding protein [Sinosporangium album]